MPSPGFTSSLGYLPFRERYPKVVIEMLGSERTSNLVEEGVDLAIRNGTLADSSLVARKIGESAIIAVASGDYLERKGGQRDPASSTAMTA